jgi:hypothetical protein
VLPLNGSSDKVKKLGRTRKLAPKENSKVETMKFTAENPPRSQVLELESEESDECTEGNDSPSQTRRTDPEWTPGSSYLKRKLQSKDTADNVAYRLRSRVVSRSERDVGADKEQAEIEDSQGSEHMSENTQNKTSPGRNKPETGHSYNLRSRVESTNNKAQD